MLFDVMIKGKFAFVNGELLVFKKKSCRRLYMGENYVLKVETDDEREDGMMWQCFREHNLWKRLREKDRKYFVPVLEYVYTEKYDYVIQPRLDFRASRRTTKLTESLKTLVRKLCRKYRIEDIYFDPVENWAVYNKLPLFFDYGLNKYTGWKEGVLN